MSRVSSRASIVAAVISIVLLIIVFLVMVLWTGARTKREEEKSVDGRLIVEVLDSLLGVRVENASSTTVRGVRTLEEEEEEESFNNEVISHSERSSRKESDSKKTKSFSRKPDLEYVQLMKLAENQYEDPPNEFSAKRRHSGHFRPATAEVWDSRPQYEFTAFGRRFRLLLAHDTSFVSPNIKITRITENTSRRENPGPELGCFYSGTVDGDPQSAVTVNLCHGMTGHVRTSTGSYIIKPAKPWRESDKEDSLEFSLEHVVQRIKPYTLVDPDATNQADDRVGAHNCGVIDDNTPTPIVENSSKGKIYFDGRRRKRRSLTEKKELERFEEDEMYKQFVGQAEGHRNFLRNDARYYSVERRRNDLSEEYGQDSEMESDPSVTWRPRRALSSEYFIEIMVAADAEMVRYHGKGLLSYILGLMSTVSRIYKDPSIGNPISISVMSIVPIDKIFGVRRTKGEGIAAADMLNKFCRWQQSNNPNEYSPGHYDTALLLTRENLCHNSDQRNCDTLGLAELGRMCSPRSSCAIVQDNGLAAAFTIAHEIGHVLDMPHDDDVKCAAYKNRSGMHNIMSRMLDDNTFPWEWSKCSRHYVTEFLEAGKGDCLLDTPDKIMERTDPRRLPGEDYSVNKQCELVFGNGSRICNHMVGDVCRRLWCTTPNEDHYDHCRTQHMPWADGTSCGRDKWCYRGECVSRSLNLQPVDGQWGEWGRYGKCSRTCGGGIKKKYRECDNPLPQNGGRYCIGEQVKYRSCGTRECPPGTPDFRDQQCSYFNNNNLNIKNLSRDVKWHAKILPHERCKLYCETDSNQCYPLAEKVIDGTPCDQDTFHICVNGFCKPAGCDHVLNSTAELDICGVCKGDNSTCQWITGSYNSTQYGYTRIAKIPAGSNNIDIRQPGWKDMIDDGNYLALRLGEGGKYIVNGNFKVMTQRIIVDIGVTIEYSGRDSRVERLNTSRPIETDLILEVLSVSELNPPQISYKYTVPRKILESYEWKLSGWSDCTRTCQGIKYRKAECTNIESKEIVADDYCRESEKPREESQMCNNHCLLEWNITVSECSNHCGLGTRVVTSRCIQKLLNSNHPPRAIPPHSCAHLERPNEIESCMGPCEDAHWSYGKWSACNATCGGGIQYRTAICIDSNQRTVSEENCMGQRKILENACANDPCPKWTFKNWSNCSVTCGIGKQYSHYACHIENRVVPDSYCGKPPPEITQACNSGPCEQWHKGDWSACSVTCGEGIKRRKVICKTFDGITSNKCSASNKPDDITACILKPCPTVNVTPIKYSSDPPYEIPSQQDNEVHDIIFHYGYKWHAETQKCSRPCIKGYMNTTIKCVSIETGIVAPDRYCDNEKKPSIEIPCNRYHCPIWITSDWGQCNVECGLGTQYRRVYCQNPQGESIPDENCHKSEKPEAEKICRKRFCVNILRKWRTSNWTPCSKSCGTGLQRRRVECTMRRGNHGPEVTVRDEHCSRLGLRKPRSQRSCRRIACNYIWQEGSWSECSKECGQGIQTRTVSCHRVNRYGLIDPTPTDNCPIDQKPENQQFCKLRECDDKYYWYAGPWKKCSHACGQKGRETRRIFCLDRDGRKVARYKCPKRFKPQRKQKCNQRKCYAMSCLEVKKYFKTTKDSEYNLVLGGRSMSIYCHGMLTSEPKEYLTLPAGPQENYAEIYDKTFNDPYVCPYNGPKNNNCSCSTSGKTTFRRVRIDPVELYIIENDYTFSWMTGSNRVEYGTAGDCNSIAHCAQGHFSINLSGTQLKLSSSIVWTATRGTSIKINHINSQHITGKCGGYCGSCKPKNGLKLDVLPP